MGGHGIKDFLKEARRRRVFRVVGLYIVGAWVFLQVSDLAFPALGIPEASIRFVWGALVIGLPIALIFGWRFDIVDGRLVRTESLQQHVDLSLQRADYVILTALIAVAAAIAIGTIGEISDTQIPADNDPLANEFEAVSIAVLPFQNLETGDPNDSLGVGFAASIRDKLGSSKLIHAIGMTSSLRAKANNLADAEIGEELRVDNLLSGTLRLDGTTVHVTARLRSLTQDSDLWSASYSQVIPDIFRIQEDIAGNVHRVLSVQDEHRPLVSSARNTSLDAFTLYSDAEQILRRNIMRADKEELWRAITLYNGALQLQPNFSDALAGKAQALVKIVEDAFSTTGVPADDDIDEIEKTAKLALEINETNSRAYAALGGLNITLSHWRDERGDQEIGESYLKQAIKFDSSDSTAYSYLASVYRENRSPEFFKYAERAFLIDPLSPATTYNMAVLLTRQGKLREAARMWQRTNELQGSTPRDLPDVAGAPRNLGFEAGMTEWFVPDRCSTLYEFSSFSVDLIAGRNSLNVTRLVQGSNSEGPVEPWCFLGQRFDADSYRQSYVELTGWVKPLTENPDILPFLRVWSSLGVVGSSDTPVQLTDVGEGWSQFRLVLYVPSDSAIISYGVSFRSSSLLLDDFQVRRLEEY